MVSLHVTTHAFCSIELIDKYELIDTLGLKGGSRAAATSKMECFVIIANGWKPLTIITKHRVSPTSTK